MCKSTIIVLLGFTLGCSSNGGESDHTGSNGGSGGSSAPGTFASNPTTPSTDTSPPSPELVGYWKGTWTQGDTVNHGSISFAVTGEGSFSGQMAFASSTNRNLFGPGTITGTVHGSTTKFAYEFENIPLKLTCTGTFGQVANQEVTVSYTMSGSTNPCYFSLTKQ